MNFNKKNVKPYLNEGKPLSTLVNVNVYNFLNKISSKVHKWLTKQLSDDKIN